MKTKLTIGAAIFAAVATTAMAETIVDTFENDTAGSAPALSWSAGTVVADKTLTEPAYGYPTTATHTNTLDIAGTATRATSGNNVFDMMVKLNKVDDDLPTPEASPLFAVAVDTSGALKLYCKETADDAAGWSPALGTCADDTWMRLTFDVSTNDNSFVVAKDGVLTGTTYYLANPKPVGIVTNVTVEGSTAIDDFVATSGSFAPYAQVDDRGDPAVVTSTDYPDIAVPTKYLTTYSLPATSEAAGATIPNSSLKVAQAYQVGVAPTEGATFEIEEAAFDGTNLTLTFPGDWPAGSYTVKYGTTAECLHTATGTATKEGGNNKVTLAIPDFGGGNVLYYKVSR